MGAWNFTTQGSPSQVSQAYNNFLNGYIGIQPDQGILQGIGTVIGSQLNLSPAVTNPAIQVSLQLQGEVDQNNTWFRVNLFPVPLSKNPFSTTPLTP